MAAQVMIMGLFRNKTMVWTTVAGIILCGSLAALLLAFHHHSGQAAENGRKQNVIASLNGEAHRALVRSIHPKRDSHLTVSVSEPAKVEAFDRAELKARVAGIARKIHKDLHNRVREGEILVEIEAPDLIQDLAMKEAAIVRRQSEVTVAMAKARIAETQAEVAHGEIDLKKGQVKRAIATRDYRKIRYQRFVRLAQEGTKAVDESVVDEEKRDYEAAEADCEIAAAGVKTAILTWREAKENSEAAIADIDLKKSLVEEARKERDKAQAMLDLTRVTAPFDGVVIERNVDPGSFVQNAATGNSEPLMTVARTDIMTISMKVPDVFAPYVDIKTEAALQLDELPGIVIHGKVTRYSPSIQEKDRTMLVEVDLYNGTYKNYEEFITRQMATLVARMGHVYPLDTLTIRASSRDLWLRNRKGFDDPLPLYPKVTGKEEGQPSHVLLPGMFGTMKLVLERFQDCYLIPSSAVFKRGGKEYIALVEEGKARLAPVKTQVDDGALAKVSLICSKPDKEAGEEKVFCDLTGNEEIILGNQGELEDGQPVRATLSDW